MVAINYGGRTLKLLATMHSTQLYCTRAVLGAYAYISTGRKWALNNGPIRFNTVNIEDRTNRGGGWSQAQGTCAGAQPQLGPRAVLFLVPGPAKKNYTAAKTRVLPPSHPIIYSFHHLVSRLRKRCWAGCGDSPHSPPPPPFAPLSNRLGGN